jgi:hypothetical protein
MCVAWEKYFYHQSVKVTDNLWNTDIMYQASILHATKGFLTGVLK